MIISIDPSFVTIDDTGYHTAKVASKMQGYRRAPNNALLPPGLRMIGPRGDYWVFERPPGWVSGSFQGEYGKLLMPWVVIVVTQNNVKLFARPAPIMRPEDMLYHLPLPGIKEDGTSKFKPNGKTIGTIYSRVLSRFSEFDWSGLVEHLPAAWPQESFEALQHWGTLTMANIHDVKWKELDTVAGVLDAVQWKSADPMEMFVEAANA